MIPLGPSRQQSSHETERHHFRDRQQDDRGEQVLLAGRDVVLHARSFRWFSLAISSSTSAWHG